MTPVTFFYNEDEDAIDVGGISFGGTKKWRDAKRNARRLSWSTTSCRIPGEPGRSRFEEWPRSTTPGATG